MSLPSQSEKRIAVRAGLFASLALGTFALVILLIGRERHIFDRQVRYHVAFRNVEGLKKDAPVWLGGLDVGRVEAITFSPDLGDKRIHVSLQVAARYADRIRKDSVARLTSRGVLGDKAVDVSLGSVGSPKIPVGGEIPAGASGDLTSLLHASGKIVDNAIAISGDLRKAVKSYADPQLRADLGGILHSTRDLLEHVQKGDGALHALIYDPKTGRDVRTLLANAGHAARSVDVAVDHVSAILERVRNGPGALHALVYDPKGAQAVAQLGSAAGQLSQLLADARKSPNGAVHQLIYGDARGMFADLGSAAADLKKITHEIAQGKGSLGALIQDPTVYDDLRTLLGRVKRNRVLRALVRWSIVNGQDFSQLGHPEPERASAH